ncbi:SPASM domain-containing protein [Streptomyces sp. NPDC001220]
MTVTSVHAGTTAGPWPVTEFTERLRAVTADRYRDRHPFNQRMHRGEPPPAEPSPAEPPPAEPPRWITNRFHCRRYRRYIPVAPPWALLVELTHACPLRCGCCSHPVRLTGRSATVAPDGTVLPCPAAATLPGLDPPNVRECEPARIRRESKAVNAYPRMREPCRGCAPRTADFGGCRRQAYALTGDARNTDPACRHVPGHRAVPLRRTTEAAAYREGGP